MEKTLRSSFPHPDKARRYEAVFASQTIAGKDTPQDGHSLVLGLVGISWTEAVQATLPFMARSNNPEYLESFLLFAHGCAIFVAWDHGKSHVGLKPKVGTGLTVGGLLAVTTTETPDDTTKDSCRERCSRSRDRLPCDGAADDEGTGG
jgi:hypothetical protein